MDKFIQDDKYNIKRKNNRGRNKTSFNRIT